MGGGPNLFGGFDPSKIKLGSRSVRGPSSVNAGAEELRSSLRDRSASISESAPSGLPEIGGLAAVLKSRREASQKKMEDSPANVTPIPQSIFPVKLKPRNATVSRPVVSTPLVTNELFAKLQKRKEASEGSS